MAAGNASANLSAPLVSVKSTGGQTLSMSISASRSSSGTTVAVQLDRRSSKSDESHSWNFSVSKSSLSYSSPKGKLATGSQLGAYGALSLAFTKVSSSTKSCGSISGGTTKVTTTTVKFKGKINFAARDDTKASSWGSVKKGSTSSPYTFAGKKGVYISTTNGPCDVKITNANKCFDLWTWEASPQNPNGIANLGGQRRVQGSTTVSNITALNEQLLSSPKNASRIDSTTVKAPAPQFDGSANPNTLHASTASGTASSGGGTMTATQSGQNSSAGKCTKAGGGTAHESATFWPATWTNDSQKLTIKQAIGGNFSVADNTDGYFQHFTFS